MERTKVRKLDNLSIIIVIVLAGFSLFVWREVLFGGPTNQLRMAFLDVGQGDATLLVLPGNIKILTDAGPDRKVLDSLEKALSPNDRYVDIAVISHPQIDHFNGFNHLLDNYRFGAFIFNGISNVETEEWKVLLGKIKEQGIPLVTVTAGDHIRYGGNDIKILSPNNAYLQSGELNDTSIVELINAPPIRALLAADIDSRVENYLMENNFEIHADILKVGHHGSKYSSSEEFLKAVNPKLAVVEVGSNNRYGHPTEEVLLRLKSIAAEIFRTDESGIIEVVIDAQKLKVFTEK